MEPSAANVVDNGLLATNALYSSAAGIAIVVVFALLGWFIISKVRKSDSLKAKLNEFGYDEKHFESLVLGAITFAEQAAITLADKSISKNKHSLNFLQNVDPDLVTQYGDKVQTFVKDKAIELGKVGWTDSDGDGVLDTPPVKEVETKQ